MCVTLVCSSQIMVETEASAVFHSGRLRPPNAVIGCLIIYFVFMKKKKKRVGGVIRLDHLKWTCSRVWY